MNRSRVVKCIDHEPQPLYKMEPNHEETIPLRSHCGRKNPALTDPRGLLDASVTVLAGARHSPIRRWPGHVPQIQGLAIQNG